MISRGAVYVRDEPFPFDRMRGLKQVRHLHTECVPDGAEIVTRYTTSKADALDQLYLPFRHTLDELPFLLLQGALVEIATAVPEGTIIEAVTIPWFEIVRLLTQDPRGFHQIPWRTMEELIAGAYKRQGWDVVTLTSRSRDRGRDIIAEKHGLCSFRIVDQIKAYGPGRRVTADEVRSLLGVLSADPNVSKGFVTTTAEFSPGIADSPDIVQFMPYRLELKDGRRLREWLIQAWQSA